jgi:hypothetical protein
LPVLLGLRTEELVFDVTGANRPTHLGLDRVVVRIHSLVSCSLIVTHHPRR